MRRPTFWLALPIAGVLAIGAYFATRPKWRPASEAEIRAILDPALLETDPIDGAAQARFKRLARAMKRIEPSKRDSSFSRYRAEDDPLLKLIEQDSPVTDTIRCIVLEGTMQLPDQKIDPIFPSLRRLSTCFAFAGFRAARRLDVAKASKYLLTSLAFNKRLSECANEVYDIDRSLTADMVLFKQIGPAIPYLKEAQLAPLAAAMPPTLRADPNLRRGIRRDLQKGLLPVLADPLVWAQHETTSESPREHLAGLYSDEMTNSEILTYDARLTAQNVNRVFVPLLNNAMSGPDAQDLSGDAIAKSLAHDFPVSHMAGKEGFALTLAKHRFDWEMAQTRNSFGDRLILFWNALLPDAAYGLNFTRVTLREAIRTRIALHRYRLAHGHPAPSLQALVDAKLLPSLPLDGFGPGALRYDVKRSRLWSVGQNGKDDGGQAPLPDRAYQLDYVWETP